MSARGGELVATDESTVVTELLFDPAVVEDGQNGGCLVNSTSTNQGDRSEVVCEPNDPLDQLAASEAGPWWWRR